MLLFKEYLRRLRVPEWHLVSEPLRQQLIEAAKLRDPAACDDAVFSLYDLSANERAALGGNAVLQDAPGRA